MSWLDFFRNKKEKADESNSGILEVRKVTFAELDSLFKQENDKLEKQNLEIKEKIRNILIPFISELKFQSDILRGVDVDKRKEQERIKILVKENLLAYASHLEKLAHKLDKIKENSFKAEEYAIDVQSIFNNFKVNSKKSFEKATILVGKELEEARATISDFLKNFNEIAEESRSFFEKERYLSELHSKKAEVLDAKKSLQEINNSISNIEGLKKGLEEEKSSIKKEYDDLKESKEFKKAIEEKKTLNKEINELNIEAIKLKEKLNIKSLIKFFHRDLEKTNLLKEYQNSFLNALDNDASLQIVEMVKIALGIAIEEEVSNLLEKARVLKEKSIELDIERRINDLGERLKLTDLEISNNQKLAEEENKKVIKLIEREKKIKDELVVKTRKTFGKLEIIE